MEVIPTISTVSSVAFIGLVIIAITQATRILFPKISGALTIIVAMLVGVAASLWGVSVGVEPISIAQGITIALGAVGVHTLTAN